MELKELHGSLHVRPACATDVENIWRLLGDYAEKKLLLPRSQDDILGKIDNFQVGEVNGIFVACVALRDFGNSLYEVRSLAVVEEYHDRGIGSSIVLGAVDYLRKNKAPCRVFALTYRAHFFTRIGFSIVDKSLFPEKIWSDCAICPKKEKCDETAVLLELP